MKKLIKLIFIATFIITSCSGEEENCKKNGCEKGFYCNVEKSSCEKSCTQAFCDDIAERCNEKTGLCEPWCITNDDCDEYSICNDEQNCEVFYINFIDKNLENCVKEEMNISSDSKISFIELESIKKLECPNKNISNIDGIEYFKNIEKISFWENNISDITKLANLINLKSLQLGFNEINDISALVNLVELEKLSLAYNNLNDVSTLRYLPKIEWLNLDNNNIENINFFINLIKLKWLTIENNPIIDVNTTISQLKANGARVYYKVNNKKSLKKIDLTQLTENGKKINLRIPKITRFNDYTRTTSDTSYNKLERFILEAPNQADAGSCLYMANTGAMEIILNQTTNKEIKHDGDTDISERYLMNADNYAESVIDYTMTDLIRTFNFNEGALLNKDYPFTVGWVLKNASGQRTASAEGVEGAFQTAEYNWINELPDNWKEMLIPTPKVGRTLLFLDPDLNSNSIWNVGLMNEDLIERIKYELRTKNAPVVVIYNHYLVWHTDVIVGYDDNVGFDSECPLVKDSIETYREKGRDSYADKIEAHMASEGGCREYGIFYVRDSIYDGDDDSGMYYYGGTDVNDSEYYDWYSKKIIYHSYDWVKYLGNHVYSIHRVK